MALCVVSGTHLHGSYCKEVTSCIHSCGVGEGRAGMDGGPCVRGTFMGTQFSYFSRSWDVCRKDSPLDSLGSHRKEILRGYLSPGL